MKLYQFHIHACMYSQQHVCTLSNTQNNILRKLNSSQWGANPNTENVCT